MELATAFAVAFNRHHRGAWECLLERDGWRYVDDEFAYRPDHAVEDAPPRVEFFTRMLALHTESGDMSVGLSPSDGPGYHPVVLGHEVREGFAFEVPYRDVEITHTYFSMTQEVIMGPPVPGTNAQVPDIVHDIEECEVYDREHFVVDVLMHSATIERSRWSRYRVPIGDIRDGLKGEDTSVLLCQSIDQRNSTEERASKRKLMEVKGRVERFWTPRILSHPWVTDDGQLAFLNGARFPPSWIGTVGTEIGL